MTCRTSTLPALVETGGFLDPTPPARGEPGDFRRRMMLNMTLEQVPHNAVGIRLCKVVRDELRLCEPTIFVKGRPAVQTLLNRASISGSVGPVGETGDYWADFMAADGTWVETVALDRDAWNSIKNHWARTTIATP